MRRRLCVDIDNVVAQTDKVMRRVIREASSEQVALRYEDVTSFNYWECRDSQGRQITRDEWEDIHQRFSESRNIVAIEPYPGVQTHLRQLSDKYEIHLTTSRLPAAELPTTKWLEHHDFPPHQLHFVPHRQKHLSGVRFHMVIEDDRRQAELFACLGIPAFLLAHPWNVVEESDLIKRTNSWAELMEALYQLEV